MKRTLATSLAALVAGASMAAADEVVNFYNWGNVTPPELIEKFEAETGIRVTVTDYDSNDTALARIRQGGHGFDLVVPSNNYVETWIQEGLVQPLDRDIVTNIGNIDPQWLNVDFDPGREYSTPYFWGTTGLIVNTSVYDGDPHTASIILDPPEELRGRINVVPEMSDIMTMAIRYNGGEQCESDMEILRAARDTLMSAREHWLAMDYGNIDAYVNNDISAGVYWNGGAMRARLQNDDLVYGYPQEGFSVWMDNVMVLADAQNSEGAMKFVNFLLEPENAAMISNFSRYASGVMGYEEYLEEEMRTAPEIVVPSDLVGAGSFSIACPQEVNDIYSQIWTELMQ
ncbi:extracellular solute-binding protein [Rhodobacteraceae bacterium 2376]|uniref:Putrescine-binding periplasmic protein n=1 Tax=Rhabdonatronobacter sediminivivens TaxID=2743469 RepID=A0A7Z0HZC0_9RHOB|nr:extracellular solute-binding protein [Rhabdonatronobacter sediminivivens]NYS25074.1 extracellular solute-binding protein [Rhabdonatronobacter sediminivivens]